MRRDSPPKRLVARRNRPTSVAWTYCLRWRREVPQGFPEAMSSGRPVWGGCNCPINLVMGSFEGLQRGNRPRA